MTISATPPGLLQSVVTYLEMANPPADGPGTPPAPDVRIAHRAALSPPLYRALYRRVGEAWLWWERLPLSDQELADLLADPSMEIRLLHRGDEMIGFSELDRRQADDVKLVYFGLVPDAIGHGLGRWFLGATLAAAWEPRDGVRPRRIRLHTCTEDHPRALAFYQAAGFRIYRVEEVLIRDPRACGLLPADAAPHVPRVLPRTAGSTTGSS